MSARTTSCTWIRSCGSASGNQRNENGRPGSGRPFFVCGTLHLPVLGTVVLVVGADGVLHHDRVAAAEVVVEPLRVGRTEVDAAVADVGLALIGHRPRRAVHEVAAV